MITGKDLIALGYEPGPHFGTMLEVANELADENGCFNVNELAARIDQYKPEPKINIRREDAMPFTVNLNSKPESDEEKSNYDAVFETMRKIMRTPVVQAGAVMPDAMPAGPSGTIPVGGVVSSLMIHPGMHSADICCSMAISIYDNADPADLLDAVHGVTHFGPRKRSSPENLPLPDWLLKSFDGNPFFKGKAGLIKSAFGTQGDGNHFAYVGTMKSTGKTALVTHHGSRAVGAQLYKDGMRVAEKLRRDRSPETLKQNAWIDPDTEIGEQYWDALQKIRVWTRENHYAIHNAAEQVIGVEHGNRFWNEHNFVFRKSDGLFYHAKGATPAFDGWADDAGRNTIIPLNMAEPILIARGNNAVNGLGFAPHGAGRNYSRSYHKKLNSDYSIDDIFAAETKHIDARFYSGNIDITELPSAYKDAATIRAEIKRYKLAEIVDEVMPFGCIMAGDWEKDAHWRKKKDAKLAEGFDK